MEEFPYAPSRLLDFMLAHLGFNTDLRLAEWLGISAPALSKMRKGKIPFGAAVLVRMHEETGLSVKALRQIMGDRRSRFRGAHKIYSEEERAMQRFAQAMLNSICERREPHCQVLQ